LDDLVSRLWSRFGLRTLSIFTLVFGLVGGAYVSIDRNTQPRDTAQAVRLDSALQSPVPVTDANSVLTAAQKAAQQQAAAAAAAAAAKALKAEQAARAKRSTASRSQTRPPSYGPIPKSCSAYTGNRAIGCSLLLAAGYGLDQMPCLDKMWTRESNWRTTAENPSSGSYGIPQALPASKMATFGSDYRTNPATQIKWGLSYIKDRYKSPCGAWTFWQAHNWY
jgi:hypothetical protein